MGGSGSGRQYFFGKKTTVEDSMVLTARAFKPFMDYGPGTAFTMNWTQGEEKVASISFTLEEKTGSGRSLRFSYTVGKGENARAADYLVRIEKTAPHFGGVRWYLLCPLMVNGRPCLRRSSKLYLPPGGLYFGCRECYGLTYTSCQESHKFDRMFKALAASMGNRMTAREVKSILNSGKK